MLYTTQQLTGGPRYSQGVKVGNWQEDQELEELKVNDYQMRKTGGQLDMTKTQGAFSTGAKKVPQTFSADGKLRFGDKIMLSNKKTDACLVANIGEKIAAYEEAYAVTSSPHISGPNARCIFIIERVNPSDGH